MCCAPIAQAAVVGAHQRSLWRLRNCISANDAQGTGDEFFPAHQRQHRLASPSWLAEAPAFPNLVLAFLERQSTLRDLHIHDIDLPTLLTPNVLPILRTLTAKTTISLSS